MSKLTEGSLGRAFAQFEGENGRQPKVLVVPPGEEGVARKAVASGVVGHLDIVVEDDIDSFELSGREPLRSEEARLADAKVADHRPSSWPSGEAA